MHGRQIAETVRPFAPTDLGRRVRVLWQGAEYRGRGRETQWQGSLRISGNRIVRHATVNFVNPERVVRETEPGSALAWTSVTTGNLAGVDLWLEEPRSGRLSVDTNIVSGELDLSFLEDAVDFLGRRRPRPADQHPSLTRGRMDPPGYDRAQRPLFRSLRSTRLPARHASRRSSSLVKPDLPDRLRCYAAEIRS